MDVAMREDGEILIGDRTVAELVERHRLVPVTGYYMSQDETIGRWCGCGVGLILLGICGTPEAARRTYFDPLSGKCKDPVNQAARMTGLEWAEVEAFEHGWCGWRDPRFDQHPMRDLGVEAHRQADLAYQKSIR